MCTTHSSAVGNLHVRPLDTYNSVQSSTVNKLLQLAPHMQCYKPPQIITQTYLRAIFSACWAPQESDDTSHAYRVYFYGNIQAHSRNSPSMNLSSSLTSNLPSTFYLTHNLVARKMNDVIRNICHWEILSTVFSFVKGDLMMKSSLTPFHQLLVTLMRLRLGFYVFRIWHIDLGFIRVPFPYFSYITV